MDFEMTQRQLELVESFRGFAQQNFSKEKTRQWQRDQGLPDDVCQNFVREYYRHKEFESNALEGTSGVLLDQALITEELSRYAGTALPFSNDLMNIQMLQGLDDAKLGAPLVDAYRESGRLTFALAVSEPTAGSDTMSMKTNVRTQDGKLLLNGRKTFVVNGEYAPKILVAAIDGDAPTGNHPVLSFWLIPRNLEGVSAFPINKIGQKILPFSDVVFDNVKLDSAYRLVGKEAEGFHQLFHLLETGRVLVCATSLGLACAAMEDAVEHAASRKAFGQPIGDFQQIEQMLVDMEVKIRNMRNLTYNAAWQMDNDSTDRRLSVALMKRYVPAAATEVASDALQILGGRGYTGNERVSWIWQDCRGNQIAEGTDQIMVRIAAPLVKKEY